MLTMPPEWQWTREDALRVANTITTASSIEPEQIALLNLLGVDAMDFRDSLTTRKEALAAIDERWPE